VRYFDLFVENGQIFGTIHASYLAKMMKSILAENRDHQYSHQEMTTAIMELIPPGRIKWQAPDLEGLSNPVNLEVQYSTVTVPYMKKEIIPNPLLDFIDQDGLWCINYRPHDYMSHDRIIADFAKNEEVFAKWP
jgi:hypothetical protein